MNEDKSILDITDKITENEKIVEALRKSREIYHNLFNNAEVGMFRTIVDGSEVLNVNEKFLKILGWKREEVIGKPTQMHWADPDQRKELLGKLKANNRVTDYECMLLNKKKEVRDCLVSLNIYPAEGVLNGSIIDITERKQMEKNLSDSEEKFRTFFETASDYINVTDEDGNFTYVNDSMLKSLEYSKEEMIGMNVTQILTKKTLENDFNLNWSIFLKTGKLKLESTYLTKTGKEICCEIMAIANYDSDGNFSGSNAISRNITEYKKAERLIKKTNKDLQNLTAYMDIKVEEEKKKIARKIHDDLGQLLTAIKMNCSLVRKRNLGNEMITSEFDEVLGLLDKGIQKVQEITKEMRSEILDDLGIFAALHARVNDLEKKYEIKVNLVCKPKHFYVDPEMSVTIYKIYMELLTNILRHAQSKKVEILFIKTKTKISLIIRDFGIGITQEQISSPFSFGLIGIAERLNMWKGQMKIQGIHGKGTTVKIQFPLLNAK